MATKATKATKAKTPVMTLDDATRQYRVAMSSFENLISAVSHVVLSTENDMSSIDTKYSLHADISKAWLGVEAALETLAMLTPNNGR